MGTGTTSKATTGSRPGEAELWFARMLEPDISAAERAAFQRWHDADPAHAAAWRELDQLWRQSADAVRHPALAAAAWRALHEEPPAPWYRRIRFLLPAVAAVASTAVAVLVLLPRWRAGEVPAAGVAYQTSTGQQRSIRLADGTTVTLDAQSSLLVRYDGQQRRVDLLHGRAQFAVRHDPRHPFAVHAGNGVVTDIGTVFQVRTDADCTSVTLLKGAVDVAAAAPDHATERVSLSQGGNQVWFGRDGRISPPQPADLQAAEGWTEGKLFVHDWRLPELLGEMNRYNHLQMAIGDPSLAGLRVSGVFNAHDPQTLLQLLQKGWPVQARYVSASRVLLLPPQQTGAAAKQAGTQPSRE
ncbi:FecR family protein [Rhodanobacter aciditrophus]|uniref:FecR family protein n=1 Tax=Rhodanobacter aciditrophus TaxID=1623218 RepID=UPI003CE9366B